MGSWKPVTGRNFELHVATFGHGVRTAWMFGGAVIAVVVGVSTLNMISANYGMATLNEIASPLFEQFGRSDRQA